MMSLESASPIGRRRSQGAVIVANAETEEEISCQGIEAGTTPVTEVIETATSMAMRSPRLAPLYKTPVST